MKYYKLTPIGANREEIGVSPQSTECYFGDVQKEFIPFEGKINFDFELPIPKLRTKAKISTMLSVAAIPAKFLVIKNYFINFLKDFDIGHYQKWDIEVKHKNKIIKDYALFFTNETKQSQYIDFKSSEFFIGSLNDYTFVGENINITDYENYLSTREILRDDGLWLKHKKVVFNLSNTKEDMFRIVNVPNGGYFVSERLKSVIQENKYTGMAFKEISDKRNNVEVIY